MLRWIGPFTLWIVWIQPLALWMVPTLASAWAAAAEPGLELFEKSIRPALIQHCQGCHSEEAARARKLKGSLKVDSREGLLTGGDSGPAVVPGKPAESLLLSALQYQGELRMPPAGKLPDSVIADFERWIRLGAPDPRSGSASAPRPVGLSIEAGRQFWAYRPVKAPEVPPVQNQAWPLGDIDRFILARLEAKGLSPAPTADRATLIRRVYFDLIGLPPSPEEIVAFEADHAPDAYERLVDRLLGSPHFGERWGRHWLDIARFGESMTLRGFVFKEAWRYRDYVIDSLNDDRPYDTFVREQIAGDLLPSSSYQERRRHLIATTYLMLGNINLEEQDKKLLRMDLVDEQLDAIGKGLLAQTITCARCHDHKFDPIPTRDYYALAGIFRNVKGLEHANVSQGIEVPLPGAPEEEVAWRQHDEAVAALQKQIKELKARTARKMPKIIAVSDVPGFVVDDAQAKKVGNWQHSTHSGHYIGDGYIHDQNTGKGEKTLTFQPDLPGGGRYEVRLAYSSGMSRAANVPVTVFSAEGEKTILVDMRQEPPIDGRYISLGEYRVEQNGQGYVLISTEGTRGHVTADAVTFIPVDRSDGKTPPSRTTTTAAATDDVLRRLETELKQLQSAGPRRPKAMSVLEEANIEDARIHIRGSVHNLGPVVPRGFLQVAAWDAPRPLPRHQSGRKELAEWMTDPRNPLTARVFVNRVWHWLFGAGIVRTVDNFGTTGEAPSHPELLDYLAGRFIADGWSIKRLVRSIVLSRTYQQSSIHEAATRADPENRLLARMNRRRLEAECLRDAMLHVAGGLDLRRGGPSFPSDLAADYGYASPERRRSIYMPAFRNSPPDLIAVFDPADPSVVTGRRDVSTVAPQALFMLNHPLPAEQARQAAERLLSEVTPNEPARIERIYLRILGRRPSEGERRLAERFLTAQGGRSDSWAALIHGLLASGDFRFLD